MPSVFRVIALLRDNQRLQAFYLTRDGDKLQRFSAVEFETPSGIGRVDASQPFGRRFRGDQIHMNGVKAVCAKKTKKQLRRKLIKSVSALVVGRRRKKRNPAHLEQIKCILE